MTTPPLTDDIDPKRLYSFSEACRYLPSTRGGHVHVKTLWLWLRERRFQATYLAGRQRRRPFIRGAELQRMLEPAAVTEAPARVPSRRELEARERRADEYCRARGF